MQKIGLIADIHANLPALKAVLEDMPETDKIICAGDIVGYGPQPNKVVELTRSKKITTSNGNHDYAIANEKFGMLGELGKKAAKWTFRELTEENLSYLKKLEKRISLDENGYEIFIAHGTPRSPLKEYLYPSASNRDVLKMTQTVDSEVIALGHTHVPLNRTIQGKLIINPGSVGQPRDRNPDASYMILKLGEEKNVTQKRVSYDVDDTAKKIEEQNLPEKLGTRIQFGW